MENLLPMDSHPVKAQRLNQCMSEVGKVLRYNVMAMADRIRTEINSKKD